MKALYSRTFLRRRGERMELRMDPWLVLRTRSHQESTVRTDLQRRQINSYLPTHTSVRRRSGGKPAAEVPLFPGYVFVQPQVDQFESIRYVRGSCGLVLVGTKPAAMSERELKAVQRLVDSGASLDTQQQLMPGLRVEVIAGALAGVEGELIHVKRRDRLVINAYLLCSNVSVEVDAEKISIL